MIVGSKWDESGMKTTFEDWMKQVDREIERIVGMSSGDLPDVLPRLVR